MFDSVSFTNVLGGGALIGLSSLLLFTLNGRIAGICGMAFSLMATSLKNNIWRIIFLVGLVLGSAAFYWLTNTPLPPAPDSSLGWLILGGVLVGYGTSMGNGCTSGHGSA